MRNLLIFWSIVLAFSGCSLVWAGEVNSELGVEGVIFHKVSRNSVNTEIIYEFHNSSSLFDNFRFNYPEPSKSKIDQLMMIVDNSRSIRAYTKKMVKRLKKEGFNLSSLTLRIALESLDPAAENAQLKRLSGCYLGASVTIDGEYLILSFGPEKSDNTKVLGLLHYELGYWIEGCDITKFKVRAFLRKVNEKLVKYIDHILDKKEE